MAKVTSAGHKLGQMIGNFFEEFFASKLSELAGEIGDFYCDKKGLRPKVREGRSKVSWVDAEGNKHDLDYVFEKKGSFEQQGLPAAFIEVAWRRYTKHSKNKAGEIQAALQPLKETYKDSCNFIGVILCGEFTEGALEQLSSNGFEVLYIRYPKLVDSFLIKGINLDYPENASEEDKEKLLDAWNSLSEEDMDEIKYKFGELIEEEYQEFIESLKIALLRKIKRILINPLYGNKITFYSLDEAIDAIENFDYSQNDELEFERFEIYIKFSNNDRIECSFHRKEEAINFLEIYK